MRPLNYHHLSYFRAVAHDGNLTRAAEQLHISQSALSVQIRKLEGQLGHALFERRGRTLRLTEAGRIALDYADAIFASGSELVDTLDHGKREWQQLRVGASATLSRNVQLGFLKPLLGRNSVELSLRSGLVPELLDALENLNLDVVLVNQPPLRRSTTPFLSHRLAEQTVSLVGTPRCVGRRKTLEELIDGQPMVLPSPETPLRAGFNTLMAQMSLSPIVVAEVDDMAMLRLLAREGAGIAVLPPIVVKDELASGHLVEAIQLPGITESFHAVTLERRYPNPILDELLGAQTEHLV